MSPKGRRRRKRDSRLLMTYLSLLRPALVFRKRCAKCALRSRLPWSREPVNDVFSLTARGRQGDDIEQNQWAKSRRHPSTRAAACC